MSLSSSTRLCTFETRYPTNALDSVAGGKGQWRSVVCYWFRIFCSFVRPLHRFRPRNRCLQATLSGPSMPKFDGVMIKSILH